MACAQRADWRTDHQLWVEGFVVANVAGLVLDIYLAHSQNAFRRPVEIELEAGAMHAGVRAHVEHGLPAEGVFLAQPFGVAERYGLSDFRPEVVPVMDRGRDDAARPRPDCPGFCSFHWCESAWTLREFP